MKIEVTDEDIAIGLPGSADCCPVALALMRCFPDDEHEAHEEGEVYECATCGSQMALPPEPQPTPMNNIAIAYEKYHQSADALIAATVARFPHGSTVEFTDHHKRTVRGEVVRVEDAWWYHPGTVVVRNLKTGKQRKVHAPTSDIAAV